jgi:hypothetical protein
MTDDDDYPVSYLAYVLVPFVVIAVVTRAAFSS